MIVVDTNVIACRVLPGPRAGAAEALFRQDPHWAAPLLWRAEFRHVLAGYLRAGQIGLDEAGRLLELAAQALGGGEHLVPDRAVMQLVARSACTACDGEFVALAEALGVWLVTEDAAVRRAFPRRCRSVAEALARPAAPPS